MNLNKVFILGRVTNDPNLRATQAGQNVATFSIATNRVWYDKNRQKQEQVEFHNIVVWGRQAEIASQFLKKGALILVEGRMQTRTWQDKEGGNRKTTEIIADRFQLGPRPAGQRTEGFGGGSAPAAPAGGADRTPDDEIPVIDVSEEDTKEDLPF